MLIASYCRSSFYTIALGAWSMAMLLIVMLTCVGDFHHVNQYYQVGDLVWYALGTLPFHLTRFNMLILSAVCCFWIFRMRQSQELIALHVQGVSTWRVCGMLLPAILLLTAIIVASNEWLSPLMSVRAKQVRSEAISGGMLGFDEDTVWFKTSTGFLYAHLSDDRWTLRDVYHFEVTGKVLDRWMHMPKVRYQGGGKWLADVGHAYKIVGQVQQKQIRNNIAVPLKINPDLVDLVKTRSEFLTLPQLWRGLSHGTSHGITPNLDWPMFWLRVMSPVQALTIGMGHIYVLQQALSKRSRRFSGLLCGLLGIMTGYFSLLEVLRQTRFDIGFWWALSLSVGFCGCLLCSFIWVSLFKD